MGNAGLRSRRPPIFFSLSRAQLTSHLSYYEENAVEDKSEWVVTRNGLR